MALTKSIRFKDIDPVFDASGTFDHLKLRVQIRVDEDGELLVAKEVQKIAMLTIQQKTQLVNFLNSLTLQDPE